MDTLKKLLAGGCMAAALAGAPAMAAEDAVSVDVGFDITTHYFYRGIPQENAGFILQPAVGLNYGLDDKTSLTLGLWNSWHSKQTAAAAGGAGPDVWYEADLSVGLGYQLNEKVSVSATYIALTSPNGGFTHVEELNFGLSYDHELNPSVTLAFELQNQADAGVDEGTALILAIEPELPLGGDAITVTLPVEVGISLGSYYEDPTTGSDDSLGYYGFGIAGSMAATFMPEGFGEWSLSASLKYLNISNNAAEIGAGITGGDNDFVIATVGLSTTYE